MIPLSLLNILARKENPESKLEAVVRQIALDQAILRADIIAAVSSNDQHELAAAANQIGIYAGILEWAAAPGVDWTLDRPEMLTPPGQPTF